MQKLLIATLALALFAAALPQAAADSASATYVGASPSFLLGISCADCGPEGAKVNLNGVEFPAADYAPILVTVEDASGLPIWVTACQDVDGDGFCGEAADELNPTAEPSGSGCGSAALQGFSWELATSVFVYAVGSDLDAPCAGAATTGTITLTYQ